MNAPNGMRTMLGRVRGLGSAKSGFAHWWAQRMTALALVPLLLWFVISIIGLIGADHAAVAAWAGHPVSAVLLIALIIAVFHHAQLGLTVVIEDYVHEEVAKIVALAAVRGFAFLAGLIGVVSVLKLMVGK
ncbi:MAG: succinate dehydrogenase, hydrophobic membrane anchor protein [Elstera sp.]|jgi:succinate dehydrogenase / fumarate reductase membrane anchor subunit|uniref:succinate dehydrogenase, hydrophobic membrane anchor protein n=1 Tax=Elstera sp. TaxID=1916664 RepID=UPI0037C192C7